MSERRWFGFENSLKIEVLIIYILLYLRNLQKVTNSYFINILLYNYDRNKLILFFSKYEKITDESENR